MRSTSFLIILGALVVAFASQRASAQEGQGRDEIVGALSQQQNASGAPAAEEFTRDIPSVAAVKPSELTNFFGDVVLDNDLTASSRSSYESRIINGARADPENYPFLVSLRVGAQHYCAGSIVHPKVIVTAAHCIEPVRQKGSDIPFVMRTTDVESGQMNTIGTKASVVRGGYNSATHDNDIAILLLNEPLEGVETIPMAPAGTVVSKDATLKIAGWGLQDEAASSLAPYLMEADVNFVDNEECNKILGYGRVTENMICAGDLINGRDACQGDSGGPLILMKEAEGNKTPVLLGVVSWGIGCGRVGLPGVYSSVPYFNGWIQSYIDTWNDEGRLVEV